MTSILNTRIPALLLGMIVSAALLPSPAGAQAGTIRLDRLTPGPIPVTTLAPVGAPPALRTARPSGGGAAGAPAASHLVFTTPSGPHSASLAQAVAAGTTFRSAVIERVRGGRVHETITLSDVRVVSVASSSRGGAAEDEVVLAFASLVSTSGAREIRSASP